jgi:hypothetical protein
MPNEKSLLAFLLLFAVLCNEVPGLAGLFGAVPGLYSNPLLNT